MDPNHRYHPYPSHSPRGTAYLLLVGFAALIWVALRVLPRPSRASYPCMRVAMTLAAGFVLQVSALLISALSLHKARSMLAGSRVTPALLFALLAIGLPILIPADIVPAAVTYETAPHPSNRPLGSARGIYPGRVVWIHDPAATNENCNPVAYGRGWFLNENNNQAVIDRMLSQGLRAVSGENNDSSAWAAVFQYHNKSRGRGEVGYVQGEKIFVKINATSAWSGNINPTDLSIVYNQFYGISETSPQLVLSLLRELVHVAGVAQQNIYVGDPIRHIYKHSYDIWHAEFPSVHYLDHDGWAQREKAVTSQTAVIRYSDRGKILRTGTWSDASAGDPVTEDHLYAIFEQSEYLINVPTLKGHKHAGMTAFAKNHFGSQTREDAKHLHGGLVAPEANNPRRQGYGLYRVQVDLMGHTLLGGRNLIYLLDGLWTSDYEIDAPDRWRMAPFNNDWMSSLFVSLDPVAIESVGFDFLRTEFTIERGLATYPQMIGVDDYLHQAADSTSWPSGIRYDPEEDGSVIGSLGVHEHWNNPDQKLYSRNLGAEEGIELVALTPTTAVQGTDPQIESGFCLLDNYPNPFNPTTTIMYTVAGTGGQGPGASDVRLSVYDLVGREVAVLVNEKKQAGRYEVTFDGIRLTSGVYVCRLTAGQDVQSRKMLLLR